MITLSIKLFGAFRRYSSSNVELSVEPGLTVAAIKIRFAAELAKKCAGFQDFELVEKSVLATDSAVLDPEFIVQENMRLAVLPPVCGG